MAASSPDVHTTSFADFSATAGEYEAQAAELGAAAEAMGQPTPIQSSPFVGRAEMVAALNAAHATAAQQMQVGVQSLLAYSGATETIGKDHELTHAEMGSILNAYARTARVGAPGGQ